MRRTGFFPDMEPDTKAGMTKAGIAWAGVWLAKLGITTWSDVAAFLAALYSLILICEWLWKRLRPSAEK